MLLEHSQTSTSENPAYTPETETAERIVCTKNWQGPPQYARRLAQDSGIGSTWNGILKEIYTSFSLLNVFFLGMELVSHEPRHVPSDLGLCQTKLIPPDLRPESKPSYFTWPGACVKPKGYHLTRGLNQTNLIPLDLGPVSNQADTIWPGAWAYYQVDTTWIKPRWFHLT